MESLLARHQIDSRKLAAAINFDVEFDPVSFIETLHSGTLNGTDMNEGIRLTVLAGNEAKALHRIEEFDCPSGFLASKLALGLFALLNRNDLAVDLDIAGGNLSTPIDESEFQLLALCKTLKSRAFNRADMNKDVIAAIFTLDKPESLVRVEKLYDAPSLTDDLSWHSSARIAAATGTRAAEPVLTRAFCATTAKPVSTGRSVLCATEWIELVLSEPIPLVASPSATTPIKTHFFERTFASSQKRSPELRGRSAPSVRASNRTASPAPSCALSCTQVYAQWRIYSRGCENGPQTSAGCPSV